VLPLLALIPIGLGLGGAALGYAVSHASQMKVGAWTDTDAQLRAGESYLLELRLSRPASKDALLAALLKMGFDNIVFTMEQGEIGAFIRRIAIPAPAPKPAPKRIVLPSRSVVARIPTVLSNKVASRVAKPAPKPATKPIKPFGGLFAPKPAAPASSPAPSAPSASSASSSSSTSDDDQPVETSVPDESAPEPEATPEPEPEAAPEPEPEPEAAPDYSTESSDPAPTEEASSAGEETVVRFVARVTRKLQLKNTAWGKWSLVWPLQVDALSPVVVEPRAAAFQQGRTYELRFISNTASANTVRAVLEHLGLTLEHGPYLVRKHFWHPSLPGGELTAWIARGTWTEPTTIFHDGGVGPLVFEQLRKVR
jgi:hypothetical protein